MYKVRNVFNKNPVQISAVVISGVDLAIITDIIDMSTDGVAALNIFLTGLLGLFVVSKTTNKTGLQELQK